MKKRSSSRPALSSASRRASMNEPDVQSHSTSLAYRLEVELALARQRGRTGQRSEASASPSARATLGK